MGHTRPTKFQPLRGTAVRRLEIGTSQQGTKISWADVPETWSLTMPRLQHPQGSKWIAWLGRDTERSITDWKVCFPLY
jgi:hypothetical protein